MHYIADDGYKIDFKSLAQDKVTQYIHLDWDGSEARKYLKALAIIGRTCVNLHTLKLITT